MVSSLFAREPKESEWKTLNSLIILRKKQNKINKYMWKFTNKNAIIYLSSTLVPKLTVRSRKKQNREKSKSSEARINSKIITITIHAS